MFNTFDFMAFNWCCILGAHIRVGWGKTPTLRNYPHIFAIKHWIPYDKN